MKPAAAPLSNRAGLFRQTEPPLQRSNAGQLTRGSYLRANRPEYTLFAVRERPVQHCASVAPNVVSVSRSVRFRHRSVSRNASRYTYAKTRISENTLRKEHNISLRTYYSNPGECDGLASLGGT